MSKKIYLIFFVLLAFSSGAQTIRLSGNTKDTATKQPLPNALMMVLKFTDSTLVGFSRTNKEGFFKTLRVPIDTYLVILSQPNFSDKTYLLVPSESDTVFNFKNVVLPPKSILLHEVEIIAYKEKSYYKGDTLIFTADSFKTKPNATVEDLLKKLPGVRVDANGKITIQGKEVDQVLVDGDEFFGGDPTIATRNLNASSIDNVQVYDKKNESTEEGKNETVKVLNLKLKDDGKKGYFGKVSGASDFTKFYENELLLNKFKGNRKMSAFGLLANTPKQAFSWNEIDKYGLSGEQNWSYNDETGNWSNGQDSKKGIPQTIKSGFYFNDKFGRNTKVNADYTFNQNQLLSGSETNTQFFLTDTSYTNRKVNSSNSWNQNHGLNMRIIQKLDSLTELTVAPKIKYIMSDNKSVQTDEFTSQNGELTRRTTITNKNKNENADVNIFFKLNRNFMKKDRSLTFNYQPIYNSGHSSTTLNTGFEYYKDQAPDNSLVQRRTQDNQKMEHNASVLYVEPFTKKFKTELNYNVSSSQIKTSRSTYDLAPAGNDVFNDLQSNNFENKRLINRAGLKFIYDVKKYRISVGSNARNIHQENLNLTNNQKLQLSVNNILPNASYTYRISQGSSFSANYNTNSQQPELQQMQPVIDNSDPNRISVGNPDLKPTFTNNARLNYYFYKGISDVNFWSNANFNNTNKQISYSTSYDSLGKAVTMPINVDGNYNGNVSMGGGFPLFHKFMKMYCDLNGSYSNNVSYVNNIKNISRNSTIAPGITLEKNVEKFEARIEGNYQYSLPRSNISARSSQPYYTWSVEGSTTVKLPKKFRLSSDGKYTNNGNRTPGYNLNYFILNASLTKTFLKSENLEVSLIANDLLNQNIDNQRYITSNQIVDTKTNIIKRYFLLKVLLKLNSAKTKTEEDED